MHKNVMAESFEATFWRSKMAGKAGRKERFLVGPGGLDAQHARCAIATRGKPSKGYALPALELFHL